ncbi:TPA: O-antigen ligase family protein [Bacillus cereus]|uniref:O-antigen ligase family protein n=1 Tax=Bacillus cereus group TaxID=86661 RepID=UPI0009438285|nr:O-antigen ligase family protein [Bacillus pacificus]MCU5372183.1 O-antigen ligase family protein [Bacillus pacificus]
MTISENRIKSINSFIQALIISTGFLATILSLRFHFESGFIFLSATLVLATLLLEILVTNSIYMPKKFIWFVGHMILFCMLTYLLNGNSTSINLIYMFYYCILAYYVMSLKNDTFMLLKYMIYISSLSIFAIGSIFGDMDLGRAYSMLPGVVAVLIFLKFYRSKLNIPLFVCSMISLLNMGKLIMTANRGVIIAIVFTLIIISLNSFDKKGEKIKVSALKILAYLVLAILIVAVVINFGQVLDILLQLAQSLNIDAFFLEKFKIYLELGDITNGRTDIYEEAIAGIMHNPIFGHGIGVFHYDAVTNTSYYPHNFVLQLLYDGGILLGLSFIVKAIRITFAIVVGSIKEKDDFCLVVFIVCASIPQVSFSSNIWMVPAFWMLFAVFDKLQRKEIINRTAS